MQVSEIEADGLKREFKVVIPAGHLETRMQERLTEIARTIQMPGFRPGKVPLKMVRQKYASAVMGEVLEKAVNDGAQSAISEKGLRPAVQPKVEITSFQEGADLEFSVAVEVLPEITPMDFATIALRREKAGVPDSEVDIALGHIAERGETSEPVDREARDGDTVVIDFVGTQDGIAFPGGSAEEYQLKLGSGAFIPGFEDQLLGKKAGDEVVVEVTFPESYGSEALAGKGARFDVKLREVRQTQVRAIDDDLAKSVGLDSLDALKQAVREEIGRELDSLARLKLKRKLLDVLADNHDFPVPAALVDGEFEGIWKQVEDDRKAGRLDAADAAKSEEDLTAEYRKLAERRVRLGLLLAEVGRSNNISISQDDLNRALMNEARRFPGQEHLVFQYYRNNPEALDSLRAPIFEDKVVDFILELAKVEETEVSAAELRKDPDEAATAEEETGGGKAKKRSSKKKSAE
ncbi:MAG: trigger factor [Magnetospirillum sp.]|nr:trigger factor [Magnetospirillum sp.]